MTKEKTTSYRLGQMTLNQIDTLATATGLSKANVVQTAIDRMYQQEIKTMTKKFIYKGFDVEITEQLGGYGFETTDEDGNGISFPNPQLNTPAYATVAVATAEAKRRITRFLDGIEYDKTE